MGEFLGRWVFVGGICVAALAAMGMRAGSPLAWVLAGVWLGFCNAALRPMVLRLPWGQRRIGRLPGVLFCVLALLNTLLFLSAKSWLPLGGTPESLPLAIGVAFVTLCSFGASVRFRAHDGRWHWITYHGCVSKRE